MKKLLGKTIRLLLGSRNYYRVAKFLWIDARRDTTNSMSENGEFMLLQRIVEIAARFDSVVMFDVGANLGDYSNELIELAFKTGVAKKFKLFAFEPNPTCFEIIRVRFGEVASATFNVVPMVITNYSGTASFFITGETAGSSSIRIDSQIQEATEIVANCNTLDNYCREEGIDRLFFVKVDTEGNDMRVLEGATEMLKNGAIEFLQFEYNHRWIWFRNYLKDVFDLVTPFGYQVAKVTPNGLEIYPNWHFELEVFWEGNYLIGKNFESLGIPLLRSPIFR